MYWTMSQGSMLLLIQSLLWCAGGWLLLRSLFPSMKQDSIVTGPALGLVLHLFLVNLLARTGLLPTGFWAAAVLTAAAGIIAALIIKPKLSPPTLRELQPLLWLAALTLVITLIGRGLGIYDDRKNLSLISIMAAGDIPPHFYMNPDFYFSYHYGFQLVGANLMHTGGFFPWSAFDLAKGFTAALAILLCWSWAKRLTGTRSGGLWAAFLFSFASGSRWLLLFAPQSFLLRAGERISFWGTSQWTADTLLEALSSPWTLQGGPPFPIPFAFNSGIFPPFVLAAQAGPRSLGTITLFLALLLIPRMKSWPAAAALAAVFAVWALAAEAAFGLFVLAFVVYTLLRWIKAVPDGDRLRWRMLLGALVLGGMLSLVQGGTFTVMAAELLRAGGTGGGTGASAFSLQFPPAVVSAHLGALAVTDPYQLIVGLCEMGAALLMVPLVVLALRSWLKEDRMELVLFAISSLIGILLPLFLAYDVERDITRLSIFGLSGVILLSLPLLTQWTSRLEKHTARGILGGWTFMVSLGGFVILGSLLTAMPAATFSSEIAPLDAAVTREVWNQLEPGALVLDSHEWRSVTVTGRLTRSSISSSTRLPAWEELIEQPDLPAIRDAGYSYIYMDDYWWQGLSSEEQQAFSAPCVQLILEKTDNCANCMRRLYDIRSCGTPN